jgi:hypothetical protein
MPFDRCCGLRGACKLEYRRQISICPENRKNAAGFSVCGLVGWQTIATTKPSS